MTKKKKKNNEPERKNQNPQWVNFRLAQLDVLDLFTQHAVFPSILKIRGREDMPEGLSALTQASGSVSEMREKHVFVDTLFDGRE